MADDTEPTLGAVVLGLDDFELIQARQVDGGGAAGVGLEVVDRDGW